MINLNRISDNMIQVYGEHEGIATKGLAQKVKVPGNSGRVWHYNLTLLKGPMMMTLVSHEKEGTLTNEDLLLKRIKRLHEEFLADFMKRHQSKGRDSFDN